jgi:DNA polymerase (family 10)
MKLNLANHYAKKFVDWLMPYCERIEIAGSIRRERLIVNDVDLVVIPKRQAVMDLAGASGQTLNLLHEFLAHYVEHSAIMIGTRPAWLAGKDNPDGQNFLIQTPKCQLDIFCATEETWGTLMLCRTGSKEHNIWIATRAKELHLHWNPYKGLSGHRRASEAEIYTALGVPWIEPRDREEAFLRKLRC